MRPDETAQDIVSGPGSQQVLHPEMPVGHVAAARFADRAHQDARGWMWLRKLMLLGCRLAAIAFLVLALAAPRIVQGTQAPDLKPPVPPAKEAPRAALAPPRVAAIRILAVDAADESGVRLRSADLVAAAFAGESTGQKVIARRRAAEMDRAALEAADVVFWVGAHAPPAPGLLETFLSRGALVWVPADRRPPESGLAQALALRATEIQESPDGHTIDPAAYVSDLLGAFEGGTSGDLGSPVFRRRLVLDAAGASTLRFRDGSPAIVDRRVGKGRVVALAAGPGPEWGDLAGRAEFVVLMHSLAEALAPVPGGQANAPAPPPKEIAVAGPANTPALSVTDVSAWFVLGLAAALAAESFLSAISCSSRKTCP